MSAQIDDLPKLPKIIIFPLINVSSYPGIANSYPGIQYSCPGTVNSYLVKISLYYQLWYTKNFAVF